MSLNKAYIKSRKSYKVTFQLPETVNPHGEDIRVLGEFNDWSWDKASSMVSKNGVLSLDLELKAGQQYEYRYLISNARWCNDGIADYYKPSPVGYEENCVVDLNIEPPVSLPVKKKTATTKKPKATAVKKTTAAKKSVKSDLTKIDGIGPKVSEILNDAGIKTFADLSKKKKKDLQGILAKAGKRYANFDPTNWPTQAKKLAKK